MYLHGTSRINGQGHLEIGGCDTTQLAKQYGTPLYVYDEESIRGKCRAFHRAFKKWFLLSSSICKQGVLVHGDVSSSS